MGHPLGSLLGKHIKLPTEASITTMAFAKMGLAVAFLASCLVLDSLTTGTEPPGSTTDDEETISTATPTSVITIQTITSNPITTTNNVTYLQELIEVLSRKVENLEDKLQGEIEGLQGDITNVKGDITNVKSDIVDMQGDLVGVQDGITNVKGDITNVEGGIVDMQDTLQEEIKGVQGDLVGVQSDIVDMQSANSALCAWQDKVGEGDNGLSGRVIVYNTTYLETNGANCSLDTSTGNFTAGKSGVYQVSVSATIGSTPQVHYMNLYLRISSGKYQDGNEGFIASQQAGSTDLKTSVNAIRFISLQQGESAWLEFTTSSSTNSYIKQLKFCVSLYK